MCAPQNQEASEKDRPPHWAWCPPAPARPPARGSPSSSRWMMLSMLSLSISAIAVPPPTLPQRRRRRLAPGSHTSSFPTPRAPRAVVAAAVAAAAAAGPPPAAPLPASSSSRHWNHEKNKMAADSTGQPRAAHGCARGSAAAGPGLLYRPIGRAGGGGASCWRGRGLRAREAGPWQRRLSDTASARGILPPNGQGRNRTPPPPMAGE